MSAPGITGVTISVDFGDKEYGKGMGSFLNIKAEYPAPGAPFDQLDSVVDQGLDMYFAAWKTLLAGRWAAGVINADDFKSTLTKVELRIEKARQYLRRGIVTNESS